MLWFRLQKLDGIVFKLHVYRIWPVFFSVLDVQEASPTPDDFGVGLVEHLGDIQNLANLDLVILHTCENPTPQLYLVDLLLQHKSVLFDEFLKAGH